MGTSKSWGELAGKLDKAAQRIDKDRDVLMAAANTVKKATNAEVRRIVPDGRMSGVGRRGARVGVRYDRLRNDRTVLVRMFGPGHLLERSTSPHVVTPRRSRRRSGKRTAVAFDGLVRGAVRHPGTKGQEPWAKGVRRSREPVRRDLAGGVVGLLKEVF